MSAARHLISCCALVFVSAFLVSCGSSGSSGTHSGGQVPVFTSTPPASAAQGSAYSYQVAATDPAGGTVNFALSTAPAGATISGTTVSWTPTPGQSRASNSFTVTATTSENATATQSWNVTPTGAVTVSLINTYWQPNGPVQAPVASIGSLEVSAVVVQPDGSFTVLKGATTSTPGVFTIANVPAGNYWLAIGGVGLLPGSGTAFWTSTSTFDGGHDFAGSPVALLSTNMSTTFDLNLSGLDSVAVQTPFLFQPENSTEALSFPLNANSSSASVQIEIQGNIDWSQLVEVFLGQYQSSTRGPLTNMVLGPSAFIPNPSFTEGGTNTITKALQNTPASIDLNIQGSQWASVLSSAGPVAPSAYFGAFSLDAEPYITGINDSPSGISSPNIVLAATAQPNQQIIFFNPFAAGCDQTGFPMSTVANTPAVLTDQDLGALQYSDPFDPTWTRAESLCQEALIPIPVPDSSATVNFALVDSATVSPSSSPLAPVVGPVQNPAIGGGGLFTAATLDVTTPAITWSAPAVGAPYGYRIAAYVQLTENNVPTYLLAGYFYTAGTSITLPPLPAGNTFVFSITALADGAANVETSPYRSALPTGSASVVSAPITISSGAPSPAVQGDARVLRHLYDPQRSVAVPMLHSTMNAVEK